MNLSSTFLSSRISWNGRAHCTHCARRTRRGAGVNLLCTYFPRSPCALPRTNRQPARATSSPSARDLPSRQGRRVHWQDTRL